MIKIWYDLTWGATFASFRGMKLRFLDREEPRKGLTKIIETYHPECSTGVGKMEIPYSEELWEFLLAEGEQEFDD